MKVEGKVFFLLPFIIMLRRNWRMPFFCRAPLSAEVHVSTICMYGTNRIFHGLVGMTFITAGIIIE